MAVPAAARHPQPQHRVRPRNRCCVATETAFIFMASAMLTLLWPLCLQMGDITINAVGVLSSGADAGAHTHHNHGFNARLRPLVGVPHDDYIVIVGPPGSDKMQAALSAVDGACGVVHVKVSNHSRSMESEFMARMWRPMPLGVMTDILEYSGLLMRLAPWCEQLVPTLVVEVEKGTHRDLVDSVFHEIKLVNSDSHACRVIAVLGDAHAIHFMGPSTSFQSLHQLEFVDDLTAAEAHEMLAKRGAMIESQRAALIAAVGTRPGHLAAVAQWHANEDALQRYVSAQEEEAYTQLLALATDEVHGPAIRSIFRSIVGAVSTPREFLLLNNQTDVADTSTMLLPSLLAEFMDAHHARVLLYHPQRCAYRFLTVFHERAAARLIDSFDSNLVSGIM